MKLWCSAVLLLIVVAVIYSNIVSARIQHFSTFVHQSSHQPKLTTRQDRKVHTSSLAFIDNRNKASNSMTSLKSNKSDAEVYQEFISAAVDFSSVYVRNGLVTGMCFFHCNCGCTLYCFDSTANHYMISPL